MGTLPVVSKPDPILLERVLLARVFDTFLFSSSACVGLLANESKSCIDFENFLFIVLLIFFSQVNNSLDQAFFIVTEKEDIIGQINIPVTTLQGPPGNVIKSPVQPHKKCPENSNIKKCLKM
jgi:hypothetical protein